ncbi:MAG: OmpA family protein [Hyphomicrobiales bacterium]|nr:OmpA family protein [Hyphomicrobiales bacterium]
MTRTKQLLLAGAVIPAFALCQPMAASAGENGAVILAQQQQEPQKKPGQPQPKAPPPQQRPAAPPPAAPHPPTAQPQQPPHVQPPAAQQQQQPQPHPGAGQQVPHPQAPAAQQPTPPAHPSVSQPQPPAHVVPPAAQQPQPQPHQGVGQQQPPTHQAPPTGAQQQPPTHQAPPTGAQQQPPAHQAPPTGAGQQQPQPQSPAAQQPPAHVQPPAAQQQPPVHGQPPAAQQHPAPGVAPAAGAGFIAPPRTNQAVEAQRKQAEEWRSRKIQDLLAERHETHEGNRTVIQEPGRTIVQENGHILIRHDEVERFGIGARNVHVEQRGSDTVTVIERPGGINIVTYNGPDGRLLRRVRRYPDGREVIIIDNPVREYRDVSDFYVDLPPPVIRIPRERYILDYDRASEADVYAVLTEPPVEVLDRAYSLDEIRYSRPLLERMPSVDIDTINFDTGSWTVTPDAAARLAFIADAINKAVAANPSTVFLMEGHTDAVGSDVDNLSLSDRRAEAVATLLSEQFQVPPENLTTQGYGKQYLKIPTDGPERRNRRVTVRNITPLLVGQR